MTRGDAGFYLYRSGRIGRSQGTQTGRKRIFRGGKLTQAKPLLKFKSRGAQTFTKKKKPQQKVYRDTDVGSFNQHKVAGGRTMRKNVKGAWKMLNANKKNNVYGGVWVNRFMTASGSNPPGNICCGTNWGGSTAGSGLMTLPLHLWSLSAAPNVQGSTVKSPNLLSILNRTGAGSSMYFTQYNGSSLINTAGQNAALAQASFPGQSDLLKSASIKFVFYGTLTRPVKYRIDLVQILADYMHPDFLVGNASGNTSSLPADEAQATLQFYDELTREYTYSPATFHNGNATKGKIKYLKSWTHIIEPRLSTEGAEADTTHGQTAYGSTVTIPHSHLFNIFHKFNRRQRYNWDDTYATAEPTTDATDIVPSNQGINKQDVTYKARVYLMVRALATEPSINGTWNVNVTPSYDISVRTYHTTI